MTRFGTWLREARDRRGWTLEVLAKSANTSHPTISRLEHGRANPSRKMVLRLAEALGVDPADGLSAAGFLPTPEARERRLPLGGGYELAAPADKSAKEAEYYARLFATMRQMVAEGLAVDPPPPTEEDFKAREELEAEGYPDDEEDGSKPLDL
jgi:transcriptional regulator with XRE-family HTH domain